MPRSKSNRPCRDLVLDKLASRAGMTLEEWINHLQVRELERLQVYPRVCGGTP